MVLHGPVITCDAGFRLDASCAVCLHVCFARGVHPHVLEGAAGEVYSDWSSGRINLEMHTLRVASHLEITLLRSQYEAGVISLQIQSDRVADVLHPPVRVQVPTIPHSAHSGLHFAARDPDVFCETARA